LDGERGQIGDIVKMKRRNDTHRFATPDLILSCRRRAGRSLLMVVLYAVIGWLSIIYEDDRVGVVELVKDAYIDPFRPLRCGGFLASISTRASGTFSGSGPCDMILPLLH
jgi:hypothetical protein